MNIACLIFVLKLQKIIKTWLSVLMCDSVIVYRLVIVPVVCFEAYKLMNICVISVLFASIRRLLRVYWMLGYCNWSVTWGLANELFNP